MLQATLLEASGGVVSLGRGARRGSGIVVAQDRVVTLRHPLRADVVELSVGGRDRREGQVVGIDEAAGIAVIDVPTADAPPARWAPSPPQIGDPVFALGNPGTGLRITAGSVSAPAVTIRSRGGRRLEWIEHTAPMPRGAGGGPLVDAHGELLGLNALRIDAGFLLALPAATVRAAIDAALEGRRPPRLGVALASPQAGRRMRRAVGLPDREGLLVRGVEEDGPAARAGVLAGDLLTRLSGVPLGSLDDLHRALDGRDAAGAVAVTLIRGSDELALELVLDDGAR